MGSWLGLCACEDPVVDALPFACSTSSECGAGWVCAENGRCEKADQDTADQDTAVTGDSDDTSSGDTADTVEDSADTVDTGDTIATPCEVNTRRCAPETPDVPELCGADGIWQAGAPCTWLCLDGVCGGSCEPGTATCDGKTIVSCDDTGTPIVGETCANNCVDGACVGACEDGTYVCRGVDVLQRCVAGVYEDNNTCDHVCRDGACGGDCKPSTTRCESGVPATCDASGQWQVGEACEFVCVGDTCGGMCEPGDTRCAGEGVETCTPAGAWEAGSTCAYGCGAGVCLDCVPEGQTVTCGGGRCGLWTDNCGDEVDCATTCATPGATCGGGGIEGVCGCTSPADTVTCQGRCGVVTDTCGKQVVCSAANGGVTCVSAGLCGAGTAPDNVCCEPTPVGVTCAGRCGLVVDDCEQSLNCGDTCSQTPGYVCGGAAAGVCGCVPGTKRCEGARVRRCEAGVWVDETTCPFVCEAGVCAGACAPGTRDCNGQTPRNCGGDGRWVEGNACSTNNQTCVGGVCQGECIAGTRRCGGSNGQTQELCSATGTWQSGATCGGQACVAGVCTGVCAPGEVRCQPVAGGSGTAPKVLETCDSNGQWVASSTCTYFCNTATTPDRCDGDCQLGAAPRCSGNSTQACVDWFWRDTANCPSGCNGGTCCQSTASLCTGDPGAVCNSEAIKDCGQSVMCGGCDAGLSCGVTQPFRCGCQANTLRCNGNVSQRCNGTTWVDEEVCAGAQTCIAALGDCGECTPNMTRCNGNTAETCGANGRWPPTGGGSQACGATNQWCVGGTCQGVCAPGQISCLDFYQYVPCQNGSFVGTTGNCSNIEWGYLCQDENPDRCGCIDGERRCGLDGDSIQECQGGVYVTTQTCTNVNQFCCEDCGVVCRSAVLCQQCEFR